MELPDELSYEEAFAQLETVLATLESGELSLDESLAQYELGTALAALCERKLDEAELRVRQWQPDTEAADLPIWDDES